MDIIKYMRKVEEVTLKVKATDGEGESLDLAKALEDIINELKRICLSRNKVIFIGNGGSASIASHMAVDLWKNGKVKAVSFNDPAQLTCISNDLGYEKVFSHPLKFFAEKEDVLFAISSSGASINILNAVEAARRIKCRVFTLSGFSFDNPLRMAGDINLFVDDGSYGIVETSHAALCHFILDTFIERQTDVDC